MNTATANFLSGVLSDVRDTQLKKRMMDTDAQERQRKADVDERMMGFQREQFDETKRRTSEQEAGRAASQEELKAWHAQLADDKKDAINKAMLDGYKASMDKLRAIGPEAEPMIRQLAKTQAETFAKNQDPSFVRVFANHPYKADMESGIGAYPPKPEKPSAYAQAQGDVDAANAGYDKASAAQIAVPDLDSPEGMDAIRGKQRAEDALESAMRARDIPVDRVSNAADRTAAMREGQTATTDRATAKLDFDIQKFEAGLESKDREIQRQSANSLIQNLGRAIREADKNGEKVAPEHRRAYNSAVDILTELSNTTAPTSRKADKKAARQGAASPAAAGDGQFDNVDAAKKAGKKSGDKIMLFDPNQKKYRPFQLD